MLATVVLLESRTLYHSLHVDFQSFIKSQSKMSGRGPPRIEGMTSLKVDNLTYRTTCEDLRRVFEKYGDVGDVYIPKDRFSRESRGFAFVRYGVLPVFIVWSCNLNICVI